jgi:hypothetical protein
MTRVANRMARPPKICCLLRLVSLAKLFRLSSCPTVAVQLHEKYSRGAEYVNDAPMLIR